MESKLFLKQMNKREIITFLATQQHYSNYLYIILNPKWMSILSLVEIESGKQAKVDPLSLCVRPIKVVTLLMCSSTWASGIYHNRLHFPMCFFKQSEKEPEKQVHSVFTCLSKQKQNYVSQLFLSKTKCRPCLSTTPKQLKCIAVAVK